MPIGYRASVADGDDVLTATGPQDRAWLARGAADPASAVDIFAWWGDERDATHYEEREPMSKTRAYISQRMSTHMRAKARFR